MEKSKVSITISNQKYTVVSDESPEDVKALAKVIDKKTSEIMKHSGVSLTEALILTSLELANIAKESEKIVTKFKNEMASYLEDVEKVTIERDKLQRELDKLKKK